MEYEFDIQYNSGASNRVADALSRKSTTEAELGTIEVVCGVPCAQIQ